MDEHFNDLTPAELERLAYLAEEMCEAGQMIGKILRHGYDSRDPTKASSPNNRVLLERELGDVLRAIRMMTDADDLTRHELDRMAARPTPTKYMHHQNDLQNA
jgi:hypothetical protein